MFFEVYSESSKTGDIGLAESSDGITWNYKQIVITEPFHLSYPYVFKWKEHYYMVPESNEDLSVRIYRSRNFPTEWEYIGNLLTGYHFVDPTIIRYKNLWWLLVSTRENDALNLYYSADILGPWQQHPKNPVVKNNNKISRPGGSLLLFNDKLYRYAQDDSSIYGKQVFVFEITALSEKSYKEKIVSDVPIVKEGNKAWNVYGMHTVCPVFTRENGWIAGVDGNGK